jgi:C4-dicarboxylate-specific signal transduction histidine kinase
VVVNAVEALRNTPSPRIDITAAAALPAQGSGAIRITIADNGPGIDPKLLPNVFSPFCTGKGAGLGLGLPIVERTLTDHDGEVHIDSTGRGTTVTITLPAEALA